MTNTTLIKTLSRIADQLERIGDILEAEIKNQDTKTDTELEQSYQNFLQLVEKAVYKENEKALEKTDEAT